MISGRTGLSILKQVVHTFFRYFIFLLSTIRGKRPKLFICSFGIRKRQHIFDFSTGELFSVVIPSVQDYGIFLQVFGALQYNLKTEWLQSVTSKWRLDIKIDDLLILDLGSNIGLSSRFFLQEFPNARIALVEPSHRNMNFARINVSSPNASFFERAISNQNELLDILDPGLGPAGFRVVPNGHGVVHSMTVSEIMRMSEFTNCRPFIIKIDIEGFESNLFESNFDWIDEWPIIIIELHDWLLLDQGTSRNFLRAISGKNRNFVYKDENIFSF